MSKAVIRVELNPNVDSLKIDDMEAFNTAFKSVFELTRNSLFGYMSKNVGVIIADNESVNDVQKTVSTTASIMTALYVKSSNWSGGGIVPTFLVTVEHLEKDDMVNYFQSLNPEGVMLWNSSYEQDGNHIVGVEMADNFDPLVFDVVVQQN